MFRKNNRVYTTDSKAAVDAEDVGVQGKRYPTNALGRTMSRHPWLMMLTIVPVFVFFVIGFNSISDRIAYSFRGFQLSESVAVQHSADAFATVMDDWGNAVSGGNRLLNYIDVKQNRSQPRDQVELRAIIDPSKLQRYCIENHIDTAAQCGPMADILYAMNLYYVTTVESQVANLPTFRRACFTNDLEYGHINIAFGAPDCVPPTGISQYVWPTLNSTATLNSRRWSMNGLGTNPQIEFLPRMFVNPNYAWFFDNGFSVASSVARQLRTGFVLASSPGQSDADYRRRVSAFVSEALRYVRESVAHPYITVMVGGAVVEDIKVEAAASGEGYKVGVAVAICVVLSWWHCGSVTMGLYAGAQVVLTYFAAVGLYAVVYGSLPLMTYSAIVWVMTFGLHGTLSFYDMFVYSGVMATKGRQNHLSVAQRLCFTLRRITLGVWLANVLAIVIFAVNTTSAFDSVRQFSVLMMMAFLWNMYCIALPTPAFVCVHHYHFSNKRRNLQKQTDVLNAAAAECRRGDAMVAVLAAVQGNVSVGEGAYSQDAEALAVRLGATRGINQKRASRGLGDFLAREFGVGRDRMRAAHDELVGAAHKARKTKEQVLRYTPAPGAAGAPPGGGAAAGAGSAAGAAEAAAFVVEDFADVGPSNPLGNAEEDGGTAAGGGRRRGQGHYYNRRMVRPADVVHVPPELTVRSEQCWAAMRAAVQPSVGGSGAPRVPALPASVHGVCGAEAFTREWQGAAEALDVTVSGLSAVEGALPLVARAAVRAQDPELVVGGCVPAAGVRDGRDAVCGGAGGVVDPGTSGLGLRKLRQRWAQRRSGQRRSGCCGLCGRVEGESAEQRMARLMRRSVKREGYTLFERFVLRAYVPFVHRFRWVLLVLLVALAVAVCVAGSFVRAAGVPTTLVTDDDGTSALFASMEGTFGQRGTCVFCGPYYRPLDEYRTATLQDVEQCAALTAGAQMNVYPDLCGVCGGSNACLDCAGVPNGGRVLQCGGCELANQSTCTCEKSHECPYCEWALGVPNAGGNKCTKECTPSTCGSSGHCNAYTGQCVCDSGFAGAACDDCAAWLVPISANADCTAECNAGLNSEECHCELNSKTCTGCPVGLRGYKCDQPAVDCGAHGTYNASTDACVCAEGWGGELCDVSVQCHLRGPLLSASESPTGEAMCACRGHWRGATCQLCDCMNGGMCDDETGACKCSGAFVGQRCQTCDATCAAHGRCPRTVLWPAVNVRSCIYERCSADAIANEETCANCPQPKTRTWVCDQLMEEELCNRVGACWWVANETELNGGSCFSAVADSAEEVLEATKCLCSNDLTFSGDRCEVCLAPPGATCMDDGTVVDCTGLTRSSAFTAVARDSCGVCGGDGMCRGCDGVPNSGAVMDLCGVCGGDNSCIGGEYAPPMYIDLMIKVGGADNPANPDFISAATTLCQVFRNATGFLLTEHRCILEDYLAASNESVVTRITDLYNFAKGTARMNEVAFTLFESGEPKTWTHMIYRAKVLHIDTASSPQSIYSVYDEVIAYLETMAGPAVGRGGASYMVTSTEFPPAAAIVLSKHSLWFAVGIGLAVSFVLLFVFFVSFTAALGCAAVAAIVCFGTLTVCTFFPSWELDAVLQVCVSCTIPIGVEYVVHMTSGYFDYLQTTTSHLFAKDVSRKTAVVGAMLRSLPSVCTSVVAVVLSAIAFNVSNLVPSRRSGQVCITMHLVLLVAVFLFSGAAAAIGPLRTYQHWTLSAAVCLVCGLLACMVVVVLYAIGGLRGPTGEWLLA